MAEAEPTSEVIATLIAAEGTSTEPPLDPAVLAMIADLTADIQLDENQRTSAKTVVRSGLTFAEALTVVRAGGLVDHAVWTGALGTKGDKLWVYSSASVPFAEHEWKPSRAEMESRDWREVAMIRKADAEPKADPSAAVDERQLGLPEVTP